MLKQANMELIRACTLQITPEGGCIMGKERRLVCLQCSNGGITHFLSRQPHEAIRYDCCYFASFLDMAKYACPLVLQHQSQHALDAALIWLPGFGLRAQACELRCAHHQAKQVYALQMTCADVKNPWYLRREVEPPASSGCTLGVTAAACIPASSPCHSLHLHGRAAIKLASARSTTKVRRVHNRTPLRLLASSLFTDWSSREQDPLKYDPSSPAYRVS